MNMAFISEREVVANCFPFNKVMTLKKPLTTSSGTFEAGTTVVAFQVRKGDYYIDLYSANGSDYFNLKYKIDLSEKDTAKRNEEIRKFAEKYFAVDTEKTKAFDNKLNSLHPSWFAICPLLMFVIVTAWLLVNCISKEVLDFPYATQITTALFAIALLFIYAISRKQFKQANRECNLEDKDKIQKIISKI